MSDTFCNVLILKVALFVSMIHIIYISILCGYLLPYFIIYDTENGRFVLSLGQQMKNW